ncbi:prolactin regulatory element-binding protein isoform X3 [Anastrepha obliqua]|uniref:prolactin regulatory element-binding protein isoform X2 n=1 Tax=Anastrepha ludens TaxID=28586 RepID=UPI0023AFAE6D|nr:prolactin regulatory element-binding protein isoform X2 [Anastrepha ludens]XP_054742454.1 prolactin regulatory element-binding protein isoform X3 [Anastrepha obliqua]
MAPTRRPSDGLLARVNFPLYAIEMLTSRHVLVAGGGGSAKTGVANGFEIYEIYHNGTHFCAEEVVRHETGANVVMNFAVRNDGRRSYLCAGQESHCQLYFVNPRIVYEGQDEATATGTEEKRQKGPQGSGVQDLPNGHAMGASKKDADKNANLKRIRFDIKACDSVQTDFLTSEPLQRVVRISPNGRLMATGGTDGHLRVWSFPQMIQCSDVASHSKEIDDLDFSPDSKYVVTISKDGKGLVWDLASMKQHSQLKWATPEGSKYLYKRCRYGTIEAQRDKYRLFTITNPFGKVGKQRGFLQQWDCISGQLRNAVQIDESLASLAVRDDGRFVAVGSMFTGTVSIYIAFSLQRVLHIPSAHSMFVTGLQFLPITNEEGPPISSDTEAAVLSISVDNKVCIHSLQQRRTIPAWVAILLIIVVLFGAFVFCSYVGI